MFAAFEAGREIVVISAAEGVGPEVLGAVLARLPGAGSTSASLTAPLSLS